MTRQEKLDEINSRYRSLPPSIKIKLLEKIHELASKRRINLKQDSDKVFAELNDTEMTEFHQRFTELKDHG